MSALRLPSEARVHSQLRLVTWHPSGVLDAALAHTILDFIEAQEAAEREPWQRFADFSALTAIRLDSLDLTEISSRRITAYQGPPVKTAILSFNALDFGIAHMYARLVRDSPIEVRVFCRITSAAMWLNQPVEALLAA